MLKIECIGDNIRAEIKLYSGIMDETIKGLGKMVIGNMPTRYWVAEITGLDDKFGFQRIFMQPKKDYSESNSKGSRGVYAFYFLENNKIYEIKAPVSWRNNDRYFCRIENDEQRIIDKGEVKEWLEKNILT